MASTLHAGNINLNPHIQLLYIIAVQVVVDDVTPM